MGVKFRVSFPDKKEHFISVEMLFEAPCDQPILELPSWTPGSYLIREYARHIMHFQARAEGNPVSWRKIAKNNWELDVKKGTNVQVSYRVYSFEMTVRTNYIDDYLGLINGTATFFYICEREKEKRPLKKISIELQIDPGEFHVFTSLKQQGSSYLAKDYDELYDSPIGLAVDEYLDLEEYTVEGIPCRLALIGKRGNHQISQLAEDLRRIQETSHKLFGELPYDHYLWLLYLRESGGGGLEHKFSNVSIAPRWNFRKREKYLDVLRLESHEHFHVYNVKRIRPNAFIPYDYDKEVYTTSLWIAEGLTNYYEKKILLYSGIYSIEEYVDAIEKSINNYLGIPGRFETSLAESSFDAWIKLYRPNENSPNSVISYYLKGGLVGLLFDIEIRDKSEWTQSLDDVFRGLYKLYKKDPNWGYQEDEFPTLVEQITGVDVNPLYQKCVHGVDELPFSEYLEKIGIQVKEEEIPCTNLFGIKFEPNSTKIKSILTGSPALDAGLSPGDEIVSLAGFRFSEKKAEEMIQSHEDGKKLDITFFHDGVEIRSQIRNVQREKRMKLLIPNGNSSAHELLTNFSSI
ncbi:MAG: M61 family peptidase [Methanobacteriota archaeon]|nr:MAG: M61 family peptidase [Euryarchaeota archaeon]